MNLKIGEKVQAGKEGSEDFDIGQILQISEKKALVAWQTGVRTWTPLSDLIKREG